MPRCMCCHVGGSPLLIAMSASVLGIPFSWCCGCCRTICWSRTAGVWCCLYPPLLQGQRAEMMCFCEQQRPLGWSGCPSRVRCMACDRFDQGVGRAVPISARGASDGALHGRSSWATWCVWAWATTVRTSHRSTRDTGTPLAPSSLSRASEQGEHVGAGDTGESACLTGRAKMEHVGAQTAGVWRSRDHLHRPS